MHYTVYSSQIVTLWSLLFLYLFLGVLSCEREWGQLYLLDDALLTFLGNNCVWTLTSHGSHTDVCNFSVQLVQLTENNFCFRLLGRMKKEPWESVRHPPCFSTPGTSSKAMAAEITAAAAVIHHRRNAAARAATVVVAAIPPRPLPAWWAVAAMVAMVAVVAAAAEPLHRRSCPQYRKQAQTYPYHYGLKIITIGRTAIK